MSEQKIDTQTLDDAEALLAEWGASGIDDELWHRIISDLRAARAEIERLTDLLSKTGGAP